jgi:WD40 repeat protein
MSFSPGDGKWLALGLGTDLSKSVSNTKSGYMVVLKASDLNSLQEEKVSATNASINALRFTPNGMRLAAAAADSGIYIYNSEKLPFSYITVLECHESAVKWFDFSIDGKFIRSGDVDHRIYYSEVGKEEAFDNPAVLKDEQWASHTIPFGWALQGVWASIIPLDNKPVDEVAFKRIQLSGLLPCAAQATSAGHHIAVASENGNVR